MEQVEIQRLKCEGRAPGGKYENAVGWGTAFPTISPPTFQAFNDRLMEATKTSGPTDSMMIEDEEDDVYRRQSGTV